MFRDGYKNAQVVTSDGKKLGTVKKLRQQISSSVQKGTYKASLTEFMK